MVGGMGRAALYLKVTGFGLRPDHVRWPDLSASRHSRPPGKCTWGAGPVPEGRPCGAEGPGGRTCVADRPPAAQTCALRSLTAKGVSDMFIHFSGQNGCDHQKGGTRKDPFLTFSARLAQPRGQHHPHHQHHLHQCPPWMRMMQAMPGMLSTMGTPQKTLVFESAGSRSKNDPFSPKTHPNILSPLAARSQRKSIAHGPHGRRWSAAQGGRPCT